MDHVIALVTVETVMSTESPLVASSGWILFGVATNNAGNERRVPKERDATPVRSMRIASNESNSSALAHC